MMQSEKDKKKMFLTLENLQDFLPPSSFFFLLLILRLIFSKESKDFFPFCKSEQDKEVDREERAQKLTLACLNHRKKGKDTRAAPRQKVRTVEAEWQHCATMTTSLNGAQSNTIKFLFSLPAFYSQ